jgi:adenosylmethionine-8-amino-7-oxononanoate aminotransferase
MFFHETHYNPIFTNTFEGLSPQIIVIDKVVTNTSLTIGTSLTTERIILIIFTNKFRKIPTPSSTESSTLNFDGQVLIIN